MELLKREYINNRLQEYLEEINLTQSEKKIEHNEIIECLRAKGAIQSVEAKEEDNVFLWPFDIKGDGSDPLFLTHCNLRFFYAYHDNKFEQWDLYFTMGLFSTFACKNENPDELADEIIHIDTQLIPQWVEEFNNLHPLQITELAVLQFNDQREKIREEKVILDTFAAHVYGVTVTKVRQTISRKCKLFGGSRAFHLTREEYRKWLGNYIKPPRKEREYLPYAITFPGFCLLSMELHSDIANKVSLGIVQTMKEKKPLTELLKQFKQPTTQQT